MPMYKVKAIVAAASVDEARVKAKQMFEAYGELRPDDADGCVFGVVEEADKGIEEASRTDKSAVAEETTFLACPECGCTDVECTAWVCVNSDEVSCGDAPSDNAWCPQCEYNGIDSDMKYRNLVEVSEEKPICRDDELAALSAT